jgi:hypothetical protein
MGKYRIIRGIGIDIDGTVYTGVGKEFEAADGPVIQAMIAHRFIKEIGDEKVTKEVTAAPMIKRKYQRRGGGDE